MDCYSCADTSTPLPRRWENPSRSTACLVGNSKTSAGLRARQLGGALPQRGCRVPGHRGAFPRSARRLPDYGIYHPRCHRSPPRHRGSAPRHGWRVPRHRVRIPRHERSLPRDGTYHPRPPGTSPRLGGRHALRPPTVVPFHPIAAPWVPAGHSSPAHMAETKALDVPPKRTAGLFSRMSESLPKIDAKGKTKRSEFQGPAAPFKLSTRHPAKKLTELSDIKMLGHKPTFLFVIHTVRPTLLAQ